MKNLLLVIFALFLLLQNNVLAENVSFVYLNGSNNNDEKMKNWYMKGVKKFHPTLKKKFETNKQTSTWFYGENARYHINKEPVIFFWGDKSKAELEWVKRQVLFSKTLAPTLAYKVRETLTAYLHDAIWVQKDHNMLPILGNLNEVIKEEWAKGNKTVLYGYSAGTFITFRYIQNRLPYINTIDLFEKLNANKETLEFMKNNQQKNTCMAALVESKLGVMSDSGHLVIDDTQNIQKNYLKLNETTNQVCAPEGSIIGIVNFASPVPLFYSDIASVEYEVTYYNIHMLKYIIENGLFILTVNFREDPLGFPTTRNITVNEIEELSNMKFEHPTGFLYDNSKVWSKRSVIFAHTSYWDAKNTFANSIVKTLSNGMKFNYDKKYQEKMIKKRSKGFDIWE